LARSDRLSGLKSRLQNAPASHLAGAFFVAKASQNPAQNNIISPKLLLAFENITNVLVLSSLI